MPIVNTNSFGSIRKHLPSKVIEGLATDLQSLESWLYDDGEGDPWWQGAGASPCRWSMTISINRTQHSSHLTRIPFSYTGLDVAPGMWIMATTDSRTVRIASITSKTDEQVVCVVEDVDRYNTFRDPSGGGSGIFTTPATVVIYELGDDGLPILDPLPASASDAANVSQVEARFRVFNPNTEVQFYQVEHGFYQGAILKIDALTGKFVNATSDDIYRVGTVTAVGPGPNYFYLAPSTKFIPNLEPSLPGSMGSIVWIDPETGGLTTVPNGSKAPIYIKVSESVKTCSISAAEYPEAWDGYSITVNKVPVSFTGSDPVQTPAIISAINALTAEHGVFASLGSPANKIIGTVSFPSFPSVAPDFMKFALNGVEIIVKTPSIVFGDTGTVGWWDVARAVNEQTGVHGVYTAVDPNDGYLIFTNTSGGPINFQNIEGSITEAIGVQEVNEPSLANRLKLVRADGGEIVVADVVGSFLADSGLQSAANGKLPLALIVDASISATDSYMVEDIAAMNALEDVRSGDQVFVQVAEDGEWALFIRTGNDWTKISDHDAANTDAKTLIGDLTSDSPAETVIGQISVETRIINVTVVVSEAFDDMAATVSVGTPGLPLAVMRDTNFDLTAVGTYESNSSYVNNNEDFVEQEIVVFLNKGTSTTGKVRVIVSYA